MGQGGGGDARRRRNHPGEGASKEGLSRQWEEQVQKCRKEHLECSGNREEPQFHLAGPSVVAWDTRDSRGLRGGCSRSLGFILRHKESWR